jgi:alpha-methylacyl-CoA racemase
VQSQTTSPIAPLAGIKIVEFQGIGPGPLAGLMLAQLGADVTLVARPGASALPDELTPKEGTFLSRNKRRAPLNC